MRKPLRAAVDTAAYILAFLFIQTAVALLAARVTSDSALRLTLAGAASAALTAATFHLAGWARLGSGYIRTRPLALLAWTALLSTALVAPAQYFEELMGADMPEETARMLEEIISHPMGYMVIGLVTPVAEEMVFRGAILRTLLRNVRNPWVAIVLSAALFGAVHGNAPQAAHATLVGILLGWAYYRTGSILPGVVAHWANNSVAYALCRLFPDKAEARLIDLCGGSGEVLCLVLAISAIAAAISLWQVCRRMPHTL